MKLIIDGKEVTISVKAKVQTMSNADETKRFLCELSSAFHDASEFMDKLGCHFSADRYKGMSKDVYQFLDSKGYFDDVR